MKHGIKKQERERKRKRLNRKKFQFFSERDREMTFQVNRKMI